MLADSTFKRQEAADRASPPGGSTNKETAHCGTLHTCVMIGFSCTEVEKCGVRRGESGGRNLVRARQPGSVSCVVVRVCRELLPGRKKPTFVSLLKER